MDFLWGFLLQEQKLHNRENSIFLSNFKDLRQIEKKKKKTSTRIQQFGTLQHETGFLATVRK